MTRDDNQIWYAVVSRLDKSPGAARLSPREAREEFLASPSVEPPAEEPSDEIVPAATAEKETETMELTLNHPLTLTGANGTARSSRRRVAASASLFSLNPILAAAAVVVAVAASAFFLLRQDNAGGAGSGGNGQQAALAAVPMEPTGSSEPGDEKPDKIERRKIPAVAADSATDASSEEDGGKDVKKSKDGEGYSDGEMLAAGKKRKSNPAWDFFAQADKAEGDHVRVYTSRGTEATDRALVTAESAYRRAQQFFGKPVELAENTRMHVIVADGNEQYNTLGANLGGDEKSSGFYAFASPWFGSLKGEGGEMGEGEMGEVGEMEEMEGYDEEMQAIDLITVAQYGSADSLTDIYLTHAVVEQYVRRLAGPDAVDVAPRWFVDGVACYIGRWQKPNLFGWSRDRLNSVGGLPKTKRLFTAYTPDEKSILASGALIAFLKSDQCPKDLRSAFQSAIVAYNDGVKVSKTFRKLEKKLIARKNALKEFLES